MRALLSAVVLFAASFAGSACGQPQAAQAVDDTRVAAVMAELERNRGMGVPRPDGEALKRLVEETGAKRVVEIGTFRGYSGLWLASGLRKTGGTLTTFEIDPQTAEVARRNFARAGVQDRITIVIGDAHQEATKLKGPIDLVFIDADKEGYLDYLQKLLPLVRKGGVIVAHNVRYPTPDPRFLEAIETDPRLSTSYLNMDGPGMSVSRVR
jgi:caffeoyl-CoA O-methyltransferase